MNYSKQVRAYQHQMTNQQVTCWKTTNQQKMTLNSL